MANQPPFDCSIIFVIVKGKRPRFWKKFDFLFHFADWRRSQSKELVVDRLMPNISLSSMKRKSLSISPQLDLTASPATVRITKIKSSS
jgi:hypothetical protein